MAVRWANAHGSQHDTTISNLKTQQRSLVRKMNNTSEPRAAIESGDYKLQYDIVDPRRSRQILTFGSYYRHEDLVFFTITERAFPKELAAIYLDDISAEFLNTHRDTEYRSPSLRPYAFNDFDTFIQRTKKSYENPRASDNLDKVQAQLKETTQIMSKNLEDLLYRGDSLDRMGQMSSDLRESSRKYKRAAVRINWELLLKQVCISRHLGDPRINLTRD